MTWYTFGPFAAYDPTTREPVTNAEGMIYALDDVALATPLPIRDLNGLAVPSVKIGNLPLTDEFQVETFPEVMWVSGPYRILLSSAQGLRADAVVARDAAQLAASEATATRAAFDAYVAANPGAGGTGVTDHGLLSGLTDDDHGQYLNDARGDVRYYPRAQVDSLVENAATSQSAADRNRANHTGAQATSTVTNLESRLAALEAGGATNPFGTLFRTLDSFAGANVSAKYRQSLLDVAAMNPKPIVLIPPGTTLDAGANNPFVHPTGYHFMVVPGPEDESGYQGTVNLRHTGSNAAAANHGVFKWAAGSRDQKFSGVCFKGTATTRPFVDVALDGSSGDFPQYVTFFNVSFNQFESIMSTTGTGIKWLGVCYLNNMAATRPPIYLNGSDHTMWSNGCLFELGLVASYATRAALAAMVRFGNCANTSVGPVYWTGSPSTPVRVDGGNGGLSFYGPVLEGRPSPGTTVDASGNVTGGLHCAGPVARLTGGRSHFSNREHGYAMRDPFSAKIGYTPGGFYHITGGDHVIDGGTWTPYTAATYPAYPLPDGTTRAAGQLPHLAWVTGATTRLNIKNITRGPNAPGNPTVVAALGATVITDGSVTVITI